MFCIKIVRAQHNDQKPSDVQLQKVTQDMNVRDIKYSISVGGGLEIQSALILYDA